MPITYGQAVICPLTTEHSLTIDSLPQGQKMLKAKDVMRAELLTIRAEESAETAIEVILNKNVSGLPVLDGEGHLVGVISEFALLEIVYDAEVRNHTVSQHMTKNIISVDVSDPLSKVADLFVLHRIRRIPVLSGGKLVGLISRRDLLRASFNAKRTLCSQSREQLDAEDGARFLFEQSLLTPFESQLAWLD